MPSIRTILRSVTVCSLAAVAIIANADFKVVSHVTVKMDLGSMRKKMDANPPRKQEQTTTTYFKKGMMRVETSDGSIFIFNAKAKKSYMLRPATKQYSEFSMDNIAGPVSGMMSKLHMKISGHMMPTNEKSIILGKKAKLYKADMAMDMDLPANMMGGTNKGSMGTMHVGMQMNQWTTSAMKDKISAKETMAAMGQLLQGLAAMGADTKQLVREFSKMKGVPLNSDIVMKMKMTPSKTAPTPPAGTPMGFTMNITSRVQSISEAPVSADIFNIPADYKKTDNVIPHGGMRVGAGRGH